MPTLKWSSSPTLRGTVLSSELNSLAADTRTSTGAEIDNSVFLDTQAIIELNVTFPVSPTATLPIINFYLIKDTSGTQYADGSFSSDPGYETKIVDMTLRAVTTAQNKQSVIFDIPPCKFKIIAENKTGVDFPPSGSTVTLYTMNLGSV